MRRCLRFLLCCVLTLAFMPASAQPATALEPCEITARVVDSVTGEPVRGVYWSIYRYAEERGVWSLETYDCLDPSGRLQGAASAGSTSHRAFLFINGGKNYYSEYYDGYRATSSGPNLGDVYSWKNSVSNSGDLQHATRIAITPGGSVSLGTIKLTPKPKPYGAIVGRLSDALSGYGVPGAYVSALRYDDATNDWEPAGSSSTIDMSGGYSIVGSQTSPLLGRIKVVFRPQFTGATGPVFWPGTEDGAEARELYIEPNQTVYGVDQALTTKARIAGRAIEIGDTGMAAERYAVAYRLNTSTGEWYQYTSARVRSDGSWAIPDYHSLPDGTYRVSVKDYLDVGETFYGQVFNVGSAKSIEITAGAVVTGVEIVLSRLPAVEGIVNDTSGTPAPDIYVAAMKPNSDGTWTKAASGYTNDAGRYILRCPAGTYALKVVDRSGTATSTDDVQTFYGGSTVASATRFSVRSDRARRLAPVPLPASSTPRTKRVAGGKLISMGIMASRSTYNAGEATTAVIGSTAAVYDALAGSGLAGAVDGPVLFTNSKKLPISVMRELDRLGVKKVYLLANTAGISNSQASLMRALRYSVVRLGGTDKYGTSANVARELMRTGSTTTSTPVFIVSGSSPAGAVAVGPAAYSLKAPVVFAKPTGVPSVVTRAVAAAGFKKGYIVGDRQVLPYSALSGLRDAGMSTSRFSGGVASADIAARFASAAMSREWMTPSTVGLTTTSDLGRALVGGTSLGQRGGMILGASGTALPASTGAILTANSTSIQQIEVYASTTRVGSGVLIQAGSK